MSDNSRPIELLAPARDLTCGLEAINHGADAVYIGAPRFGARAAAGNRLEDIQRLCDHAHPYGVRIYVTLNTLLKDDELADAERMIHALYRAGVDALIIQDMGILQMDLPPIPLHASTQMDNRTPGKVRQLEALGFSQVVLARELTLAEIRQITASTHVPLEVFVHGALCVSYSGQCYLSAALSGRSANRGECAQYCRLPYTWTDADGQEIARGKHLLSLKDMNRGDRLEALLDAGVTSLKIEGRLKELSYVKNITAWYRQKLDEILARRPEYKRASAGQCAFTFTPTPAKSFNRGFTPFFLDGRNQDITAFDTPKSLGEPIGRVKEARGHALTISTTQPLNNGDGLSFFNARGELEGFRVNRANGNKVYTLDRVTIAPKTTVYRNLDQAFERQLAKPSAKRELGLNLIFGEYPAGFTLEAEDETGACVTIAKPLAKELARRPQADNIRTQLARLGDTLFRADRIEINLKDNWFIPSSFLAEMRREAIGRLMADKRIRYQREITHWKKKRQESAEVKIGIGHLTYLGNVANGKARQFYEEHGVQQVDPAFELAPTREVPLMFTKHCLRYSMGWCPVRQKGRSPYREPYYLIYKETRLRLQFDCENCQMLVWADKEYSRNNKIR